MLSYDRQVQPKAQAFVWRRPALSAFLNISMQYMSSPLDVNIITKMSRPWMMKSQVLFLHSDTKLANRALFF